MISTGTNRLRAALLMAVTVPAVAAYGAPNIRVNDVQATEGAGAVALFTVSLDAQPAAGKPVTVDVATQNVTALAPGDYTAVSKRLQFVRGGPLQQTVGVTLVDDTVAEPAETFRLVLTRARNSLIADGTGIATITDNDTVANRPPVCHIDTPVGDVTVRAGGTVQFAATVSDPDTDPLAIQWVFGGGSPASAFVEDPGLVQFMAAGDYAVTLDASDGRGGRCVQQKRVVHVREVPAVSINSTSTSGLEPWGFSSVPERPRVLGTDYSVFAVNDLGMHCVDLDGRIANILPPYQVLLGQVVRKGGVPELNPPDVSLAYSAASNPADPILAAGTAFTGIADDGTVYKTNFWDGIRQGSYDAFYPPIATPLASGPFPVTPDLGLPVPNAETLYIGADGIVDGTFGSHDGKLTVSQHAMPGIADPLRVNDPQPVFEYYQDKPFFVKFPMGYVADRVNWHEAAGIPMAPFDDFGRQNPYPLVRVEASNAGGVVATSDVVLPVSAETACSNCHGSVDDVPTPGSHAPADALAAAGLPVASSDLDPQKGRVPAAVSVEYAADINVLRLHDLEHGAAYVNSSGQADPCDPRANPPDGGASCLANRALVQHAPVVCQSCHYSPALDLAQVGPVAGPPGSDANGRNQLAHESNSRVMHNHHGSLAGLFPPIPPANQDPATGAILNQAERTAALEKNCYQCHPGKETHCLRGAMFNGGVLCSDCHGSLKQIGADFSAGVSPATPGAFKLGLGNFYDRTSAQPRVPWANEPGCGSCHTGDANANLAGTAGTVANLKDSHGVADGIRLRQAFLSGDAKATPIVPANKRFAEPVVPDDFNGFANPAAGNPKLYRVSTGHGGMMCEGCHGATHAEWPVANPQANDNLLALQMQGHAGTISACTACHVTSEMAANTLDGPHGMHLVDDARFWREAHKDAAKRENQKPGRGACGSCHGSNHLGTVLSRAPVTRSWVVESTTRTVAAGKPVGCNVCHSLEKSFGT